MASGKTRPFVLLGSPVEHSLSPAMHSAAFRALGIDAAYLPLACTAADVPLLMRTLAGAGGGGNVTVPHKESAASSVGLPSPMVSRTGACNTFWSDDREGPVAGENTDVAGILAALDRLDAPATRWLVIGTGGSARAVAAAALTRGASLAVRSRSEDRRQRFLTWMTGIGLSESAAEESAVVVNATPLGLALSDPLPMALDALPGIQVALDLVYGVGGTRWSRGQAARGIRAGDGREVLVAQGAASFRCWFPDHDPPVEVMRAAIRAQLG